MFRFNRNNRNNTNHQNNNDNDNNNNNYRTNDVDAHFSEQSSKLIPAEVRLLAACHTVQSSVDAANAYDGGLPDPMNRAGGVFTAALLKILYAAHSKKNGFSSLTTTTARKSPSQSKNNNNSLTFQQILLELRSLLPQQGYDQIPQLTSSRPLELQNTPFELQASKQNGTQRALLVGINYTNQEGALSGCHNDVYSMKHYLKTVQGFTEKNIVTLVDDGKHLEPIKHEIIRALQLLVKDSMPGDSVYFHYSGHGGLIYPEANQFKAKYKGYDETIYPLDHSYAGQIHDFSLYRHFVQPMRAGVTVTVVMDCCHCGSVLELPYTFQPTSAGTIQMRQSMDALANIAFLHILMGNVLPAVGFEDVANYIENVTNVSLADYLGIGLALEDHQNGTVNVDDIVNGNASFNDLAGDEDDYDDAVVVDDDAVVVDVYKDDETDRDNVSDTRGDCDCFGGGILSFLLSLFGGGGGGGDDDDDADDVDY